MDRLGVSVTIDGREIVVTRLRLRQFLLLDALKTHKIKAEEITEFTEKVYSCVSSALSMSIEDVKKLPWFDVAKILNILVEMNVPPKQFPIVSYFMQDTRKNKKEFEYPDRYWYIWANLFSTKYHWSLEYIAGLDVENAFGLLQELLIAIHEEKEWQWSLSELAYKSDGKGHVQYKPLKEPDWLTMAKYGDMNKPANIVRIPVALLPVGKKGNIS